MEINSRNIKCKFKTFDSLEIAAIFPFVSVMKFITSSTRIAGPN